MRNLTAAASVLLLFSGVLLEAQVKKVPLPDMYKKWLDEEVVYIVTQAEREVFLKLASDRERDMFIEAFWSHRDPNPVSPENEFKTEHYRRLEHATHYLGREAPRPGWRTDRGRMYIILGEPQEVQRFEGKSGVYDCEAWFYQGKTDVGLPPGFYLLFFKEHGQGEYRLYSPLRDGPQALIAGYSGDVADYEAAYANLREIDPTLADISIALIPGEEQSGLGRPSLTSDMLIQRIDMIPERTVEERYARKFLEYKDIVEVEYSANYIDSDSLVKVSSDPSGYHFVHLCVEPERLSVNQYEDRYFTALDVSVRVSDAGGRSVYQFARKVSIELDEEQMGTASRQPFDLHDIFPLVPGDYNLSVLIKNEASKEFTSVEKTVRVPGAEGLRLTQPVLGHKVVRLAPEERRVKAFRIGPYQIYAQPGRIFTASDTLAVAFQLHLPQETTAGGLIKIGFFQEDQLFREIVRKPSEYADLPDALEEISLRDFPPAHYRVQVSYTAAGQEISASEEFDLTFAEAVPRPWISARILPGMNDAFYPYEIGTQLFNLGRNAEAQIFLERAFEQKPGFEEIAAALAGVYMALEQPNEAVRRLETFVGPDKTPKYDVYILAADACGASGDHAGAVVLLERAVSHYGVNAVIMNKLGQNYSAMGKRPEALAAFRKSLELDPNQPEVKKRIEGLGGKK